MEVLRASIRKGGIMSIITISRGSYSRGVEIAEIVAEKLGYQCLGRDVLIEASKEFNIPEIKLIQALEDPPSFFERFTKMKKIYIDYIQTALINNLRADNIVYHGLAGHFFVKDIPHVIKVRIIADLEYRIKFVMERDKIGRNRAIDFIKRIDSSRREWGQHLYGLNLEDPIHYDIVINTENLPSKVVADTICEMVTWKEFQTTPASKKKMDNLALSLQKKIDNLPFSLKSTVSQGEL
jgi:cytidylate kinase